MADLGKGRSVQFAADHGKGEPALSATEIPKVSQPDSGVNAVAKSVEEIKVTNEDSNQNNEWIKVENRKKKSTLNKRKVNTRDSKGKGLACDMHGTVQSMQMDPCKRVTYGGVKGVQLSTLKRLSGIGSAKPKSPLVFKVVRKDEIIKGGCIVQVPSHDVETSKENKQAGNDGVSPPIIRLK